MTSLLLWWLVVSFLSLAALPLTLALFRHLPDRGYPFARVLGVLLPSFIAWFLGMWQLASYGVGLLVLGVLVVAVLSALVLWRDRGPLQFLRENWRLVLGYELLFAVALLFGLLLRVLAPWGGPAISHTEQPMDFALMNGIIRSDELPPQDPWLSGYSINYYYLGYLLAASLTLLSGVSSSIAFNLNLALLFALTVCGTFSLGYNLTCAGEATARRRAVAVGALAVLLVALVGNQVGALQVLTGSEQAAPLDAGELWTVLRARARGENDAVALGHLVRASGGFGERFEEVRLSAGRQIDDFNWWWPSRALWDERPSLEIIHELQAAGRSGDLLFNWRRHVPAEEVVRSYAITEFPFFSFYLGDMHPHVMSLPLTLAAVSLALQVILAPQRGRAVWGKGWTSWLLLGLAALLLGGLYMANSWDLPTYLLLFGGAWLWRWGRETEGRWTRSDWIATGRDLGVLLGLAILLYLPFWITFRSLVGGRSIPEEVLQVPLLGRAVQLPLLSSLFQTVGPVLWDKTSLYTLGVIFGLFLYPVLSWLVARGVQQRVLPAWWEWVGLGAVVVLALWLSFPLLLLIPLWWLGWKLLRASRPAEALVLLMLLLALLLLLGCEFLYLRDIFETRMNTIFKFYYQVWILLAVAGAWAVGQVGKSYLRRPLPMALWVVPLILLLAGGVVYPVAALRLAARQPELSWTVDGLVMMQQAHPGDYAGVRWLWQHAEPDAVVLEAAGPEWGYYGRVSAATGLPTLVGWDGHEWQWRGGQPEAYAEVSPRKEVVEQIYRTTDVDEARQLLQQYGVDYVFWGSLEEEYAEGRDKFAQLGALVFEAPGVAIYRISDEQ